MRRIIIIGLLLAAGASNSSAREIFYKPVRDNVGLYANQTRVLSERPVLYAKSDDRLLFIKAEGGLYLVKTKNGNQVWIESTQCVRAPGGTSFLFQPAEVMGYLDVTNPILILDANDPEKEHIALDRSFKDELRENWDRETIELMAKK